MADFQARAEIIERTTRKWTFTSCASFVGNFVGNFVELPPRPSHRSPALCINSTPQVHSALSFDPGASTANVSDGMIARLLPRILFHLVTLGTPTRFLRAFLCLILISCAPLVLTAQVFRINPSQLDVILSPGFNPLPMTVNILSNAPGFDLAAIQVTSDSAWVTPTVDPVSSRIVLNFATSNLISLSQTATLVARQGPKTNVFFVNGSLIPLNIVKFVDDPVRSRTYGIHVNGTERGNILVYDPIKGTGIGSITVGKRPTDLAISPNGAEMFVMNLGDKSISVIDLQTLRTKDTIILTQFDNWGGPADTSAHVEVGPGNILYYSDGAWAPVLRVFDRASGQVLQSLTISDYGFGDFAVTKDFRTLVGWAQYGWSAGSAGSFAARFTIDSTGLLTKAEQTESIWPTGMMRDPLDTPVLISADDQKVFVKQYVYNSGSLVPPVQSFPSPVYSISPGGEIAGTANALYETQSGNKLYTLPASTAAQVITSDYARLVYFDPNSRTINTINLLTEIGPEILNRKLFPPNGSIVLPPDRLSWQPLVGTDRYNIYFGTSQSDVAAAQTNSPSFLGAVNSAEYFVNRPWVRGQTYFWRIDAVNGAEVAKGDVYQFTVSSISASTNQINVATIQGHRNFQTTVNLQSEPVGQAWQVTSDVSWISFAQTNGTTPSTLTLILDASQLPVGFQSGNVQIRDGTNVLFALPVKLRVEALKLTLLESDPASEIVYGVNEDPNNPAGRAYLLEINTRTEGIERLIPVGSSVTDLAIHNGDNRVYVPNWMSGSLLAINKSTFALERSYPFKPFAGTGYGDGDVYKVSAGAPGRLVIEEQDQWIDISIFDTANGTYINKTFEREGGGAFGPGGRFYYHGDNNSSGAEIHKYDVTGDTFTKLAHIRVESAGYYGSRTVVVSEDGSRVFWNGSVFNANLVEEWTIRDLIYSTTPDGRYAFGADKIYDISQRRAILGMPATTTVSAFNSITRKLVAQVDGGIRFFAFPEPIILSRPVLSLLQTTESTATLQWIDNSLETSFTLQKRLAGDPTWNNIASIPQNTNRWVVSELSRETTYEFRIKADATSMSSDWSDIVTVTTPGVLPASASLEVTGLSSSAVILTWSGLSPAAQYFLERRLVKTGENVPWSTISLLSLSANQFLDTNIVSGTTYEYQIKGTNQWGTSVSNPRSATVPQPSPPEAPQFLNATLTSSGAVELTWQTVAGANGYKIQRRTEDPKSWIQIAQVGGDKLSFVDTNIVSATEYWYRAAAFNAVGESAYSYEISIISTVVNTACIISDTFDPGLDSSVWAEIQGGQVLNGGPGFNAGNALWFGTNTVRSATTIPLPLAVGSSIHFKLRAGNEDVNGVTYWNNSEPGEWIVLEFSLDGFTWNLFGNFDSTYPQLATWGEYSFAIPAWAASARTQIRWRQLKHSGAGFDTWAIDDVCIRGVVPVSITAPSFIMATANSSTSTAILWFGSPGASHYIIERKAEGEPWAQIGSTVFQQTFYNDTKLRPQTTYAYRVKAATTVSQSPYSAVSLVTTMSQSADWLLANTGSTNAVLTELGFDGVPNVIRYAFNLANSEPLTTLSAGTGNRGIPHIWLDREHGKLRAEFVRRKASTSPGIAYAFQVSNDLSHWSAQTEPTSVIQVDDIWERVVYEHQPNSSPFLYGRVAIQIVN